MKVLILNTSEHTGGAAVAASRLLSALRKEGIDASMLVRDKETENPNVFSIKTSWLSKKKNYFRFVWERFIIFIYNKCSRKNLFQVSIANTGADISRHPLVKEADIIHLHWINQGFLSLLDIKKLSQLGKPIVWTMHDMWPCTGICHHARECNKNQKQCEDCFFLKQTKKNDLSTQVFNKKKSLYKNANIAFVGCSSWLSDLAKQSLLCRDNTIYTIPNPINTALFCPQSKEKCRLELGLPLDKDLLLFGALNVSDKRKGIDYLLEALQLVDIKTIELTVLGQVRTAIDTLFSVPVHSMGYITDENKISTLYNAVDVFVTSSLEENLPNTIMEAMACGTPCVGFNIGGIPEMIDHKVNGYVAEYKSAKDLADGIQWVLGNNKKRQLSEACLKKVDEIYSESVVANKYICFYNKLNA
jgi:glycosyltransferase involved in cell wall biosynthesis